jgi:putative endonuclease
MDRSRVALGEWGESKVARHYQAAGYAVVDRNWRVKGGERDLVLVRGDEIVFCEVKTRSSNRFGHGLDAHDQRGRLRFDVASVTAGLVEVREAAF